MVDKSINPFTYQKVYEYTLQLYQIEHQKSCSFLNRYYSSTSENL